MVIVRNAAKFAVYEEIMMRVKSHQAMATVRVDGPLGIISLPEKKDELVTSFVTNLDQDYANHI